MLFEYFTVCVIMKCFIIGEALNNVFRYKQLYDFEFRLMELPKPDIVLYMDIDIDTCLSQMKVRQEQTNTKGDIHETHAEYLEACLKTGSIAAERLNWEKIKCLDNGAMREIHEIHEDIYNTVKGVLQ